jgi:hypothetical protein
MSKNTLLSNEFLPLSAYTEELSLVTIQQTLTNTKEPCYD